ncbi:MAG: DNA-methyltransferase, partial [Planctomycetota bacterium]
MLRALGGTNSLAATFSSQIQDRIFVVRAVADQQFICGDSLKLLRALPRGLVDVVVTSPPYNRKIRYASYGDARPQSEYLSWCGAWLAELRRVLKEQGSLFLNVAGAPTRPHAPRELLNQALQQGFTLQNEIVWVKSIYVPGATRTADVQRLLTGSRHAPTVDVAKLCRSEGHIFGHSRPVNSERFLNPTNERIYHLTNGSTPLDRLAIGIPYADSTNAKRWKSGRDKRCLGDTWF